MGIGPQDAEVEISHLRLDRDVNSTQADFMEGGRNWRGFPGSVSPKMGIFHGAVTGVGSGS